MIVERPGPGRVPPGLAPGGLVLHIYGERGQRITEQRLPATLADGDIDGLAVRAAEAVRAALAEGEACCIVAYDGDSGDRVTPFGTGRVTLLPDG